MHFSHRETGCGKTVDYVRKIWNIYESLGIIIHRHTKIITRNTQTTNWMLRPLNGKQEKKEHERRC